MKELRIDFPDYPAKEQERDAKRMKLIQHAYLMKIDGEWAHFVVGRKDDDIHFYGDKELIDVYKELKEKYPDHKPIVLRNQGIEEYLRKRKKQRELPQMIIQFER